ncbi:hypothetical protein KR074_008487 [Drosophila pseudoananassae]|nr:hypothetical protein KR074_008487 [Drosophila pseudoananassae]
MKVSVDFVFSSDYLMPKERYKLIAKRSSTKIRNKPRNKHAEFTSENPEKIDVPSSPEPADMEPDTSFNMDIESFDFPDFGRPLPVASIREQIRISFENRDKIVAWQKIHQKKLMEVWRKHSRKDPPKK